MSTRKEIYEVVDHIIALAEGGELHGIAFALVRADGMVEFGHANASYDLLGAAELCKAGMAARMFRDATDVPGFEPTAPEET